MKNIIMILVFGYACSYVNADTLIDFSIYPDGSKPGLHDIVTTQFTKWGVTFDSIPGSQATQITELSRGILYPGGLAPERGGTLIIKFTVNVTHVGSDLFDIYSSLPIKAYDKSNNLVASTTGYGSGNWFLEYNGGISRVELIGSYFRYPDIPDGWGILNLKYGPYTIPEPATLLLLGLGAVMLRRKK
jgi:hypothetical protein